MNELEIKIKNLSDKVATILTIEDNINHARSYANTVRGRSQLESQVPSPYRDAIMLIWGDTPTVPDQINYD